MKKSERFILINFDIRYFQWKIITFLIHNLISNQIFRESYSNSSVKRKKKKKVNVLETSGGGRGQDFSHLTITNQPKGFLPKVLYHGATGSPLRTKHSRKS